MCKLVFKDTEAYFITPYCVILWFCTLFVFCFREDPLRRATNKNELAETLKDDERWQDWKANHWARYQEVYSDGKVP